MKLSTKKLQEIVSTFNAAYPVGTPVVRYALINPLSGPTQTITKSPAWILGGHSAVIGLEGFSGCESLTHMRVL